MTGPQPAPEDADFVDLQDQQRTVDVLAKAVLGLWDVVNDLTRLRPSRREGYRVSIFGSARVDQDQWVYGAVRDMAAELTRMGCTIVTGGGPGLMQAANEGAAQVAGDDARRSVGIRIALPFEQDVNPFVGNAFEHRTFFTRLHHFVLVSDAFVVVPGGIGTVLETMTIWQLLQVRKLAAPLVLVGPMWQGLIDWHRGAMLRPGFELASPADLDIPRCVAGAREAIEILRASHAAWQRARAGEAGGRDGHRGGDPCS
ncbi:MAG: LOG family protein [Planctomycetes bacterium]|nr:LOG family protein [Planctomycetota bacterium]